MRTFDHDTAEEHAKAMQKALGLMGLACSADEEQAASEQFMSWAQGMGLRATFARTVADDGRMVWVLTMDTGRGVLEAIVADPRKWKREIARLGLG